MHHAYVGGLAYHSIGMLKLADGFIPTRLGKYYIEYFEEKHTFSTSVKNVNLDLSNCFSISSHNKLNLVNIILLNLNSIFIFYCIIQV